MKLLCCSRVLPARLFRSSSMNSFLDCMGRVYGLRERVNGKLLQRRGRMDGKKLTKSLQKAHVKHCLGDDKDHDIIGMAVHGEEEKPVALWVVIQSGPDHHFLVLEGYLDFVAD